MNLIFKQLEQAVILIVEGLKNTIHNPNKSENSVHKNNEMLYKQASSLLNWMNQKGENKCDSPSKMHSKAGHLLKETLMRISPFPPSARRTSVGNHNTGKHTSILSLHVHLDIKEPSNL